MTTTACLPECERNCWTGQDKHAFGCPVAAMFGAAEQAYFGPRAPQAEAPKKTLKICWCSESRMGFPCDCDPNDTCSANTQAGSPAPAPEPDPLMGIDAQKWAKEFMRIWSGRWSEVDEALMIGWFANAIMRGYDEGQSRLRKELQSANPTPAPEPKQGSEEPIDWDAAKASSESWAKGRPLPHDLKCTPAQETLGRAYVALRAEVENWRNESLPAKLIDALRTENERLYGKVQGHGLVLAERDALRAELAAAREEIAKMRFPPIGVPPEGSLPHLQLIRKPPSNRIGDNIASVIESGDPDVNAASGACVTDGETSLECPVLPVPGPIIPASDAEIAGWLCGGRDGGCEDWPECEYCRMVARIEVEKARADKAEEIILLCGLPGWEGRLISARKGILATRARQEQKEGGR